MEELEIFLEEEADDEIEIDLESEGKLITPSLENLTVNPSKVKKVFNHENSYGYDEVIVNPISDEYIKPNGTLDINENGIHEVKEYENVNVNVEATPNLQDKEVTPTKETQTVVADEGFDGLNNVVVNPIPENYVEVAEKNIGIRIYDEISHFFDNISPTYNKKFDTNEETIIYSPATDYTKYYIVYRGSEGYRIYWCASTVALCTQLYESQLYWYTTLKFSTSMTILSGSTVNTKPTLSNLFNRTTSSTAKYMSSVSYATIEEAIEALKDSSTVYTKETVQGTYYRTQSAVKHGDTQTSIVMTNGIEIGHTGLINECGRQLSSKETIVVQATE